MAAFLISLHCLFALTISKTNNFDFSVDPTDIVRNIDYPFYGFTFDFWKNNDSNGKWFPNASILVLDLSNPDLIALTKEISPAILRIGGTPQDSIIFNISGECNEDYGLPKYNCSKTKFNNTLNTQYYGCINKTRWKQINEFGLATNVTVIYGLNACYGRKSHTSPMNMSNVENLLDFTNSLGDTSIFGFEYGNEIDSHIDVNVYSSDFFKLYQMMKGKYKMLGTDNGLGSFVEEFMANLQNISADLNAADILYRLTYHHYANCAYPAGDTVFSLSCLNSSSKMATECYEQASPYNITCAMGEGSEHSGGGTPNVSNTFVDNFYYLNQLGSVLTAGDGNTMRSDLSGGNYELIDHMTVKPNPDYWVLYIWKQLIGDALYKSNIKPFSGNVRGFAFRSKMNVNGIVLALINFDLKNAANINIQINGNSKTYNAEVYLLKPDGNQLNSRMIYVNDVLMEYNNGKFPILKSIQGDAKNINLDAARIAFVVLTPQ